MTESPAPYQTNNRDVTCPRCDAVLGRLVDAGGLDFIQVGGVICREIRGQCTQCGAPFYYSVSDRMMERLIALMAAKG